MTRGLAGPLAALLTLVLTPAAAQGAVGDLDPLFGGDGVVTTPAATGANEDSAEAVAIQPDRKIVTAGRAETASGSDIVVARYNRNGSLDASFDGDSGTGNGVVKTTAGDSAADAFAVAVQADGKIVVAGVAEFDTPIHNEFLVVRFNSNGTLDTSFDGDSGSGNGIVTTQMADAGLDANAHAVVVSGGKILVAGDAGVTGNSQDFALARYDGTDGTLDTSFSGDGKLTQDFASGDDLGRGVAVQGDGKVVIGGTADSDSGAPDQRDFGVARYSASGNPDTTFDGDAGNPGGGNGKVITTVSAGSETVNAIALQSGNIVLAGSGQSGPTSGQDAAFARYSSSDGKLDTSFGGDGIVFATPYPTNAGPDEALSLVVQPDGKLVAAGDTDPTGNFSGLDSLLIRLNAADGSPDSTFQGDGTNDFAVAPAPPMGLADMMNGVALESGGKIVAAGVADMDATTGRDNALVRLLGDDATAPQTTITAGPSGAITDTTPSFAFSSDETGSTFQCKLDSGPFAPCTSPRVVGPLGPGAHAFSVRATDLADNVDATPATRSFTVATSGGSGGGGGGGGTTPTGPTKAQIVAALTSDLRSAAKALKKAGVAKLRRKKGLTLKGVDALQAGVVRIDATASSNAARRVVVLKGKRSYTRAGKARLKLKLTKAGRKLLRRVGRRLKLKLRASFTDRAGKRTRASRKVTIKRKRR